jgi:small-conductance mechanosensitive channel
MNLTEFYFGNTLLTWLITIGILCLAFIILKLVLKAITHRFARFAEKTHTDIDDLVVEVLKRTRSFFLGALAILIAIQIPELSPSSVRIVHSLLILLFLLQGAIWGNAIITFLLARSVKKRVAEDAAAATTLAALGFVSKLLLWTVILLLALDNLGVDITALVAGLGIGGIAIALALQNILGDLFASLSIVLDKPFVIGDFIIVGDHMGSVEYVGLKTTRIRSLSGEQIVFSNADLLGSRIRNFKRMFERRVVFSIGITYDTPGEKLTTVSDILKEVVSKQPTTRFDRAHFKSYGDSALLYEAVYYVLSPDFTTYMDIQQSINVELFHRLKKEGIEFAFPTRTIHLNQTSSIPTQHS